MERCELSHKGGKKQERSQLEDEQRKVTRRDQGGRRVIKGAVVVTIKTEMGKKFSSNKSQLVETWASQVTLLLLVVKNLPANAGDHKRYGFHACVGKIPWRRARQPTLVLLPEESHGQRGLVGYSP